LISPQLFREPAFLIFAIPHPHARRLRPLKPEIGMIDGLRRTLDLGRVVAVGIAAGGFGLLLAGSTLAQESGSAQQSAPAAPPSPAPNQPGFIDAVGRWLQDGASGLKSNLQQAQDKLDKLGSRARDATKDAAGAVVGLPNTRMLTAHEPCTAAQNGAADCNAAAAMFCRGKGFQTGKSLDMQSEQKCSSGRFLLEGRAPTSSECSNQIFVTRAMCQ
jgi:hypothetical protein